jgi:hypothetical protein
MTPFEEIVLIVLDGSAVRPPGPPSPLLENDSHPYFKRYFIFSD